MPDKAHRYSKTGDIVRAVDCPIEDLHQDFYCITKDCPAVMTLISATSKKDVYFRIKPSSPRHISVDCVRCAMVFEPSKYDELRFNRDSAFSWMFTPVSSSGRGSSGTKTGHIGGNPSNSLRSLGTIYRMCVARSKTDTYNGYMIGDMFADAENYPKYKDDLDGNMILECSYYKKVYQESALLFNYPADFKKDHIVVRLNFPDNHDCWHYFDRLKNSKHTEPIAIAGNWKRFPEKCEFQYQCDFLSERQLYIVK